MSWKQVQHEKFNHFLNSQFGDIPSENLTWTLRAYDLDTSPAWTLETILRPTFIGLLSPEKVQSLQTYLTTPDRMKTYPNDLSGWIHYEHYTKSIWNYVIRRHEMDAFIISPDEWQASGYFTQIQNLAREAIILLPYAQMYVLSNDASPQITPGMCAYSFQPEYKGPLQHFAYAHKNQSTRNKWSYHPADSISAKSSLQNFIKKMRGHLRLKWLPLLHIAIITRDMSTISRLLNHGRLLLHRFFPMHYMTTQDMLLLGIDPLSLIREEEGESWVTEPMKADYSSFILGVKLPLTRSVKTFIHYKHFLIKDSSLFNYHPTQPDAIPHDYLRDIDSYIYRPSFWIRVMRKNIQGLQKWEINALRKKRKEAKIRLKTFPEEQENLKTLLENKPNFRWKERLNRITEIIKNGTVEEVSRRMIDILDADQDTTLKIDLDPKTSYFKMDLKTLNHLEDLTDIALNHGSYHKIIKYFLNINH